MATRRQLSLIGLCGLAGFAITCHAAELITAIPQLKIDPQLCVLESGQDSCPVPLRVSWQAPQLPESICLYRVQQRKPLYCQYQAGNVTFELSEPLKDNDRFELRVQTDQRVLSAVDVTLARPLPELRPRRRHGWGMF